MSYPNQRILLIERHSLEAKKEFLKIGFAELHSAMKNLNDSSFKLYLYLCENVNNYVLELSSKDFMEKTSVSYSSYKRAFTDLINKGYIVQSNKDKNYFKFIEYIEQDSQELKTAEEIKEKYF